MSTHRRFPPLNAVKAFESVARNSSVSKAANELCVSQSTISQHINKLEKWFDCKLFERVHGRMIPTAGAVILQQDYQEALEVISRSRPTFIKEKQGAFSVICIHAENSFAVQWLRPRLKYYRQIVPDIEFYIKTDNDILPELDDSIEVLIHYQIDIQHHSDEVFHLADIVGVPACSPELLERLGEVKTLQDLKRYPILHDSEGFSWKRWLAATGWGGCEAFRASTYDNFCMGIEAAVEGEGAIIADHITCGAELDSGRLVPLMEKTICTGSYRFALLKKSPRANHFCEWLKTEMEQTKAKIIR